MGKNELREEAVEEIRGGLEAYLQGLVICDRITRDEQSEILDGFDKWSKDAKYGDTYYYDGKEYTLKKSTEE